MKVRVKATGDIVEVERVGICADIWALQEDATVTFEDDGLDVNLELDYWEKLKHQYAGMAMQGMLSNGLYMQRFIDFSIEGVSLVDDITRCANDYATALVNRLKEEEK
jgi:hypothetical protein